MSRGRTVKKYVEPPQSFINTKLPEIRTKILIGHNSDIHNKLMEHVNKLPFKYGPKNEDDSDRPEHVGQPYKIKCSKNNIPPGFSSLISYYIVDRDIPLEEISNIIITIYPPPKKSTSYENTIEPALLVTRDRFIYFAISDEMIEYKMIDPKKLQTMIGMAMPKNICPSISEYVERGYSYHMNQLSSVSMMIKCDDNQTFLKKAILNGHRDETRKKFPFYRHIVVVDFIMENSIFKQSLTKLTGIISDVSENDNTVKGKMATKILDQVSNSELGKLNGESIFVDKTNNANDSDLIDSAIGQLKNELVNPFEPPKKEKPLENSNLNEEDKQMLEFVKNNM